MKKRTITRLSYISRISLLFGFAFLFHGCKKENIQSEFQKYVDLFLAEGAKRGQKLNADNLTIRFNPDKNGASQCIPGSPNVLINEAFWGIFNDLQREREVFHELGHCILGLTHNNCQLPDGTSASIMCGGGGSCITDYCFSPYGGMRREYYLDQLFDRETPAPQWSKLDEFKDEYLTKKRTLIGSEEFNDNSNIALTGANLGVGNVTFTSNIDLGKLNIDGSSTLRFKNFSKTDINQENTEIETSFKLMDNMEGGIIFKWNSLPANTSYSNRFEFTIFKAKDGYRLGLIINSLAGYGNNIDKFININAYNQLLLRKVGNMYYFFLNKKIFYIHDFVNVNITKKAEVIDGTSTEGEFYLQTFSKCSIDYVKINKIIL